MIPQWLQTRWPGLLDDLAEYVTELGNEEDAKHIQAICEAELAVWRTYCQREGAPFLAELMIEARTILRYMLPFLHHNEWYNDETDEWEHIGLRYLNCTEDEWEQLRAQVLARRLPLRYPEGLITRAEEILKKGLRKDKDVGWPKMVGALTLLTGRTLVEILKDGLYARKTAFSLSFQERDPSYPWFPGPYEIPTLVSADLVLQAWNQVREVRDWSEYKGEDLFLEYGQCVYEYTVAAFGDLVPLREEEQDLFVVLGGSVYPCLATYYYCPPSIDEVTYSAVVTCRPLALLPVSSGERFAEAAVRHQAFEYVVTDASGQKDERKSLWLNREGVRIVEAVQRPEDVGRYMEQEVVEVVWDEGELQRLDAIRQRMGYGLAAHERRLQEQEEPTRQDVVPKGSLQISLRFRPQGVSARLCAFIVDGLRHMGGDIIELVDTILEEECSSGLEFQRPFEQMQTSELRECTHSRATYELARRTIISLVCSNRTVLEPERCWYIDEELLFQMIQKDRPSIAECLQDYQQEIEEHHREFELSPAVNAKAVAVTEVIHLAEYPGFFRDEI